MIKTLKECYPESVLCDTFEVHRSNFKYWTNNSSVIKPKRLKEITMVRSIFKESKDSAGARTIATIATDRDVPIRSLPSRTFNGTVSTDKLPATKTCYRQT